VGSGRARPDDVREEGVCGNAGLRKLMLREHRGYPALCSNVILGDFIPRFHSAISFRLDLGKIDGYLKNLGFGH
jgi:hypothetical protein